MKRLLALAVFVSAVWLLVKLTSKQAGREEISVAGARLSTNVDGADAGSKTGLDARTELAAKYLTEKPAVRELVGRVAGKFGRNAQAIDRTDGLRGLYLLDSLDLEAIFLYEKHPAEFRRLRDFVGGDAAAQILLHWREYFGLKRADDTDRGILIAEIARLSPPEQRIVAKYPGILPLMLADPAAVTELVQRMPDDKHDLADILAMLGLISLEQGAADLRTALRTVDQHGTLALEAFRRYGLKGFALVSLYGPVLEALGDPMPLDQSLIILEVNADYVGLLLRSHRPETVAGHLRHVAAAGLTELVGDNPNALRLVVEYGNDGERALRKAGADAADVVFGDYNDAILRQRAVSALAVHGPMALLILDKYATDSDFRDILRTHGAAIIPAIAQADTGPEILAHLGAKSERSLTESLAIAVLFASGDNGQAIIRTIKKDGIERVAQLNQSEIQFYQFLPMYDMIHLGNVLRRGHSPTSSEMTWAVIDGCFVITDVLSLAAVQPEGAIAAEAVHSEVKAAAREGARSAGRGLAQSGAESAFKELGLRESASGLEHAGAIASASQARRMARLWTVRQAGGLYRIMRRIPEALPRLSISQMTDMAGPLATKAGMRLSTWKPIRLLKDGIELVIKIPPERGLKYLGAQAVQAGVGVVGFQKMEEHLSSRRPNRS